MGKKWTEQIALRYLFKSADLNKFGSFSAAFPPTLFLRHSAYTLLPRARGALVIKESTVMNCVSTMLAH